MDDNRANPLSGASASDAEAEDSRGWYVRESLDDFGDSPGRKPGFRALYPDCYAWYVFLASLDIMFTWIILSPPLRGIEVNWLARWIIRHGDLPAMIPYKFALVTLVIAICEVAGRRNYSVGRRIAVGAVAITAVPVVVALTQLLIDSYAWYFVPGHPSPITDDPTQPEMHDE